MGMRVQEGDRSGEQDEKISQLREAVSDILKVLLKKAMATVTLHCCETTLFVCDAYT